MVLVLDAALVIAGIAMMVSYMDKRDHGDKRPGVGGDAAVPRNQPRPQVEVLPPTPVWLDGGAPHNVAPVRDGIDAGNRQAGSDGGASRRDAGGTADIWGNPIKIDAGAGSGNGNGSGNGSGNGNGNGNGNGSGNGNGNGSGNGKQ